MPDYAGAFELQVYGETGWRSLKQFERREDAIAEAQTLGQDRRYRSVKVVGEVFDRSSGLFVAKTLFKSAPLLDESLVKHRQTERSVQRMVERHQARKRARARLRERRIAKIKAILFPIGMLLRLVAIIGIGLWALTSLQDF
jgi:hypothetical protein